MNLRLLEWLLPDPDEFDTFDDTFTTEREWSDDELNSFPRMQSDDSREG